MEAQKFNLVLIHNSHQFGVQDFVRLRDLIHGANDDIKVLVGPDSPVPLHIQNSLGEKRTLVFSPTPIKYFRPRGAAIFCGEFVDKFQQAKIFEEHGIPTPKTEIVTGESRFSETEWGPFVILKPTNTTMGFRGAGIELVRTNKVKFIPRSDYPADHPGRQGSMLVQQSISSGEHSENYRVLTMFGEPLYAFKRKQLTPVPDLSDPELVSAIDGVMTHSASGQRDAEYCYEEDVLEFARNMYSALPHAPMQGCDIRREEGTGKLFALEFNAGGFTWAFSQPLPEANPAPDTPRREEQFGAFEIMARTLAERTRELASK
ncbi:MAG: hypothetical protein ACR2OR_01385 [Hyphomicrobiales bacterium]